MIITIPETADWLMGRDAFLILTHLRPDGDTIGCAGALAQGLREMGKTAYVLENPETTSRYADIVKGYYAPDGYVPDHVVVVDTASEDLLQTNAAGHVGNVSLCIDHHPSNKLYAGKTCLAETCASCGEIIYHILSAMCGSVSAKTAEAIYVALATDTGCFVYANTTADTLRIASLMIEAGAPHRELNKLYFRTKTRSRLKLESMIISGLEYHFGGAVCISTITRNMMDEAGADESDVDDIALIPGAIEGVAAGITVRELSGESDCKISVRTMPHINAGAICKHFGGGGHQMAAGASGSYTVEEFKEKLLKVLAGFFPAGV